MNNINNFGQYHKETGEYSMDFDWHEFVDKLFTQPPMDPFTLRMEWLDTMDKQKVAELLGGVMLVKGSKALFNKEISQLQPNEIETLQKYYRSLGFEVEYKVRTEIKFIARLGKKVPVNYFDIDFKPCSQKLNNYNKPDRLV